MSEPAQLAQKMVDALNLRYQAQRPRVPGLIGDGTTAARVTPDNAPQRVYFRPDPYPDSLWQVLHLNGSVSLLHGVPVIVELREDGEWMVISYDRNAWSEQEGITLPGVREHASQHIINEDATPADPVWVYRRAITMLRARPGAGLTVHIENGDLPYSDQVWWPDGPSPDMAGDLPTTPGYQTWMTVYLTRDGAANYVAGAEHDPDDAELYAPPDPPADSVPVCYVLLKDDSTSIDESMIWDARRIVGAMQAEQITVHNDLTGRDTADAHPGTAISNNPAGTISATTVQAAINELDTEKVPNSIIISTTAPISGGGDLSENRTLSVSAATSSATGVVELATADETKTGTDTERAVTPAGVAGIVSLTTPASDGKIIKSGAGVLTLSASANYTLTVPATGTVALGTGTNKQISFWNATNTVTGSSSLTWNGTGVGIGTEATAGVLFHAKSSSSSTNPSMLFENDAGKIGQFYVGRSGGSVPGDMIVQADTDLGVRLIAGAGAAGKRKSRLNVLAAYVHVQNTNLLVGTTTDGMTTGGSIAIAQDLAHRGSKLGVFNTTPITKQTVTGSRSSNAALASLLTALAAYGLITDSSS